MITALPVLKPSGQFPVFLAHQGLQSPVPSGHWLLLGCLLQFLLPSLTTFQLLFSSCCCSDAAGSFPPQGLCTCCSAWLLLPSTFSRHLFIYVCSNVPSSKRPSLVTLSRIFMCPPQCIVFLPHWNVPSRRVGALLCLLFHTPNLEQCLAHSGSSVNICERSKGEWEGRRRTIKKNKSSKFRRLQYRNHPVTHTAVFLSGFHLTLTCASWTKELHS